MKDISSLVKGAGKVLKENSPALLTAGAITGVVSTAYLVAKAAYDVGKDVNAGHYEPLLEGGEPEVYDAKALVQTYWTAFIPAAITGAATIALIVGSNRVSTRRNAALLTALSLTERAFDEYKYKVVEQLGKGKEQKVRASIAQDHVDDNPASNAQVIITGNGDVLMYDDFTGRYFNSGVEKIRKVQNDLNARLMIEGCVSVNEFYEAVGLPRLRHGDDIGWNLSNMLNVEFHGVISEDGQPCIAVEFLKQPTQQYWKYS